MELTKIKLRPDAPPGHVDVNTYTTHDTLEKNEPFDFYIEIYISV